MGDGFLEYIQRIELMAFFSGYPLLFAFVFFIAGDSKDGSISKKRMIDALPFTYALLGTLYLGLQLRNLYPDYSFINITQTCSHSWLQLWGIGAIFFWLPFLRKKIFFTLLHSLVYFYFLVKDIFINIFSSTSEKDDLRNDMKIYSISLLLNIVLLALVWLCLYIMTYLHNRRKG